jgi:hypothetical protein
VLNGGVPWCAECDRYLAPPTVRSDGTCPTCGGPVEAGGAHAHADPMASAEGATEKDGLPPLPWHFKLLCAAVATYLGYRFVQMAEWIAHRF